MELQTRVEVVANRQPIEYGERLMLAGSCFAENMGAKLTDARFEVDANPFGILYNPLSVKSCIERLLDGKKFVADDLFEHRGVYHSFLHHSRFSDVNEEVCLDKINERLAFSTGFLKKTDWLLVTFGTAYVYRLAETDLVVGNCHKLPERNFVRMRISVETIVNEWNSLIGDLQAANPDIRILLTVSPIRHLKDGAHENQLSKSTLLLAVDELVRQNGCCSYFPSYEIVMDELRDYRFYADDMVHPSGQAVSYIWERFCATQLSDSARKSLMEWEKLKRALEHKPFNRDSKEYLLFLKQNLHKLQQLNEKSVYFALSTEIERVREQILSFEQ